MEEQLSAMESASPLDATVDMVLPGVLMEFNALRGEISKSHGTVIQKIDDLNETIKSGFEMQDARQEERVRTLSHALGSALLSFAGSRPVPVAANLQPLSELATAPPTAVATFDSVAVAPSIAPSPPSPPQFPQFYRLNPLHKSLSSLWSEWHGHGDFLNRPVVGGVKQLEQSEGHKWRSHFSQGEKTSFSRIKSIILGIENYAASKGVSAEMAVPELDEIFQAPDGVKSHLSEMVSWFQDRGFIQKKRARGKHAS